MVSATSNGGPVGVQSYSHDPQGRLTGTQGPGGTASWSYDKDGNLLQGVSSGGVTTTYGYTGTSGYPLPGTWKPGELLWTQAGSGTPTYYGYDGSGHTTAISTTSGYSLTLGYDPQGRPAGVHVLQGPVQVTQTQSYNASGLRSSYAVTRTGTAPLTLNETFIYRGAQLGSMAVISNGVAYTDTFVYDQRGLPLTLIHSPAGSAAARYWYVLDGHANVVALTDSAGNAVDSYSYDAWGKPLSVNEQVTQPYRYASYWYDTELGWYWVQVRHYSPSLQRWLQPDPSRQDGTLFYVYVGDDPVDAIDPTGTFIIFLPAIWYAGGVAFSVVGGVLVANAIVANASISTGHEAPVYPGGPVAQAGPTATPQPGATPTPAKEVPAPPLANQRRKDRCSYPGPYSYLDGTDNVRIESGRVFSSDQKRKILQANRARNGGFLRSDLSGEPLVPPMGGVRYVPYVAHVDYIIPKTAGELTATAMPASCPETKTFISQITKE